MELAEQPHEAGSLADAYEAVDWVATPLGVRERWSDTLRATTALALDTRFPVTLLWGPEYVLVYNEAYTQMIGDKHPAALGRPARDVFPEVWDVIGPMLAQVYENREATWVEDARLLLDRHGFSEETFFTFSYSAVTNAAADVEGVIDIATETTDRVVDRRRMALVNELGLALTDLISVPDVCGTATELLHRHDADVVGVHIRHPAFAAAFAAGCDLIFSEPLDDLPVVAGSTVCLPMPVVLAESDPGGGFAPALLGVVASPHVRVDGAYLNFVKLVGATLARAFDRIAARDAEQRALSAERDLSVTLQQSLLGRPNNTEHAVAVRYQPAMEMAQIGGDWYDSFVLPDGTLTLVVGDVSGHDGNAAASMAQLRNLLRGIAFTTMDSPAGMLTRLETTMRSLGVDAFATAVVVQLDALDQGTTRLTWSSAGHPPIAVVDDTGAWLLEAKPDIMLGVRAAPPRADHSAVLRAGSAIVLYSDGLIERRTETFDQSLSKLLDALHGQQHTGTDQLCDDLLSRLADTSDDDIVLLVAKTFAATSAAAAHKSSG